MIRVNWDDSLLEVRRLIVRTDLRPSYLSQLRRLAVRHGLFLVSPAVRPQAGDFWFGCSPDNDWGEADPHTIGWAGLFDLEAALDALEMTADRQELVAV